ncbi:hypothetical protein CCACVL1_20937 [Corchorus capsularis]|uniref:Neprosin PEP catalytic domain-containing protein n=1 Tax=Corchorus capsularis TaxID=210143 RepID=A0A1R3H973_COCAP|nr:hypothetical protein CCACVL1_20937 [Corchorus capsularis]
MAKLISGLFLALVLSYWSERVDGKATSSRKTLEDVDRKLKFLNKPAVKSIKRSGSCREGTVPIRRIRREDLLRAASLDDFGRKPPQFSSASNTTDRFVYFNNTEDSLGPIENRAVNPLLYGDTRTRIFTYWTTDAYRETGCFDLTCSGFVQTSPKYSLGAALLNISTKLDSSFICLLAFTSSTLVEWGGQVYSPNVKKIPHTKTAMGSGDFASPCFIDNARIIDFSDKTMKYPQWVGTWTDEIFCYIAYNHAKGNGSSYPVFYFGGPGQNPNCP